jgi:hypothetical protein
MNKQRHRQFVIIIIHLLAYRVPIVYGSVNTTAEPAPFPDWLGSPTLARLSNATPSRRAGTGHRAKCGTDECLGIF